LPRHGTHPGGGDFGPVRGSRAQSAVFFYTRRPPAARAASQAHLFFGTLSVPVAATAWRPATGTLWAIARRGACPSPIRQSGRCSIPSRHRPFQNFYPGPLYHHMQGRGIGTSGERPRRPSVCICKRIMPYSLRILHAFRYCWERRRANGDEMLLFDSVGL